MPSISCLMDVNRLSRTHTAKEQQEVKRPRRLSTHVPYMCNAQYTKDDCRYDCKGECRNVAKDRDAGFSIARIGVDRARVSRKSIS